MINEIKERGWTILNGSFGKKGEWMYIGETRASVIDYIVVNEEVREEVKVTEEYRTESDHVPLEVKLESKDRYKEYKEKEREKVKIEKSEWSEEGISYYHGKCEGWLCTWTEVGEIWKDLQEKVKGSVMKMEREVIP